MNVKTLQCTLLLALLLAALPAWADEMLSVATREAAVRTRPGVFATKLVTLGYGDQVAVTGSRRAWYEVRLGDGRTGWMQKTTLTSEKLQLRAGDREVSTTASENELTLAGKGFNNEVEQEFRQRNRELDYTWVDRMETFSLSDRELQQFLVSGQLEPAGGDDAY